MPLAIATSMVFAVLLGLACAEADEAFDPAATPVRPPNVVFILADDLGYGDLSCFGQQRFQTPHLDRLAERGMRLTQHYAGSTVCAPSRCALMTGLHTGRCEIRGNREHRRAPQQGGDPLRTSEGQSPMVGPAPTIAEVLHKAGYATGAFGKWGLGYPGSAGDPTRRGFDRFFGYNCQVHAHRYFTDYLWSDTQRVAVDPAAYTPDLIREQAIAFLRAHRAEPFFCFLPTTLPHAAMEAPAERVRPWRDRFAQFEGRVGEYAHTKTTNPIAAFAAMVTQLDSDVGQIVAVLEELGLTDNTLIVFTSDNGPHKEGGQDPVFFDSNGPYRGHKRDLYEGGLLAPTIACWPGHITPGGVSDFASAGWDWLPTLCEVTGAETPAEIDGVSLVPVLLGQGDPPQRDYLYWEFHEQGGRQALRRGAWKIVRQNVRKEPAGVPELYHLPTDPAESHNLAADRPELVRELSELMDSARTPSERFDFGR
ncbi:arylsulfatase [Botrimarina hoheduenensis]|uniref:Arylsulfatase n=1 Tax=Botrimarina hoheduenensis TaxID=2528000 RepID=A0A5C5WC77_9BACT|nr:arylsulfatase [Botrimarina hoheduenensis]TWT47723.1 Arylsulfatase precursor [Botrimarina hoheduenensis]